MNRRLLLVFLLFLACCSRHRGQKPSPLSSDDRRVAPGSSVSPAIEPNRIVVGESRRPSPFGAPASTPLPAAAETQAEPRGPSPTSRAATKPFVVPVATTTVKDRTLVPAFPPPPPIR